MDRDNDVSTEDLARGGSVRQQDDPAYGSLPGPRDAEQGAGAGRDQAGMAAADEPTQTMGAADQPTQRIGDYDASQAEGTGAGATMQDQRAGGGATMQDERAGGGATMQDERAGATMQDQRAGTGAQAQAQDPGTGGGDGGDVELLDAGDQDRFRRRWSDVQARFVDDPQEAVRTADGLVAELMQSMAQGFSDHKARLESQWQSGDSPDTEELRQALQRYRSFFNRLLST